MSNVNLELINFITKTNSITGVSFASIRNYENSSGEVANHLINLGATLESAYKKDLASMKNIFVDEMYFNLPNKDVINYEVFKKGFYELQDSFINVGDKKHDGTIKEKSNRKPVFTRINSSIKIHDEKERLYIYGLRISKQILVKGEYKPTKKQHKTICKNIIKKIMNFKSGKYRLYIIEKADVMNLAKTTFKGKDLEINL